MSVAKTKLVSILLAAHNAETSLDRTLESLHHQTLQEFVVVAVDDGSADRSCAILRRHQRRFGSDRFRIISNPENIGLTKSLNRGLEAVNTRYTARIDADDYWVPDKLERQLKFLRQHQGYIIVGSNYINVDQRGQEKRISLPQTDQQIKQQMLRRNPFAHSCVIFETDVIKQQGGYDPAVRYGQDYDLWLRCSTVGKYYNLPEFLCYRATGSGISVEKQRQQMRQAIATQRRHIRRNHLPIYHYTALVEPWLVSLTPSWLRAAKRRLLG